MYKNHLQHTLILISISIVFSVVTGAPHAAIASETNGSIVSGSPYAWGENLGWINFRPTNGGLSITDTAITGYAWSQNSGWINFSPQGGGVTNTPEGHLGGHAWSSHDGWIDLSGATITAEGKFTGTIGLISSNAGRINFDCTHCDVRTDWRPLSARAVTTQQGRTFGGFASVTTAPLPALPFNIIKDAPLLYIPTLPGTLLQDSPIGPVIVELPPHANPEPFVVLVNVLNDTEQKVVPPIPSAILLGAVFFEIKAIHIKGYELHAFDAPIRITLPLPQKLQNIQRLAVYWYDETSGQWNRVPNADFSPTGASFSVTHLTRFAIFALRSTRAITEPVLVTTGGGSAIITEAQNIPSSEEMTGIQTTPLPRGVEMGRGIGKVQITETVSTKDLLNISVITFITMLAYLLAKRKESETK